MEHIPIKLHQLLASSLQDFVREWADRQTHTRTDRRRQKQHLLAA